MANAGKNNLCIFNDIRATDIRIRKVGQYTQIQYSTDGGRNYNNLESACGNWIHLFINPMGDIDGDGNDDKVLDKIEEVETDISYIGTATDEDIDKLFEED